jgi:hypothetical protein
MTDRSSQMAFQGRMRPLAFAVLLLLALHALDAAVARDSGAQTRRRAASPLPGVPVDPARSRAMRASFDSAVVDTHPSASAQKVLQTIPDPLGSSDRVAPPAVPVIRATPSVAPADSVHGEAVSDSSGTDVIIEAETDSSRVPLPEPREVLGDFSLPQLIPDSLFAPASVAGAAVPTGGYGGVGAGPSSAAAVHPDSCWGVQLAAQAEAGRAEALRSVAQSVLMIPMTIDVSGGRHRVRTRDCLNAETSEKLRRRAIDSGFADAFRTGGGMTAPAAATKPSKTGTTSTQSGKR